MTSSIVARSYADALFELGERHDQQRGFEQSAAELGRVLDANPRIALFLNSPQIDLEAKKDAVRRALGSTAPELFVHFVLVVLEKRRQALLPAILDAYRELLDEHLGRVHVQVTLAREPDEALEEEVSGDLSRLLGRTVIPHIRVDPRILGGIIVRYGDRLLDGSLRRRMIDLRRHLLEAELPSA